MNTTVTSGFAVPDRPTPRKRRAAGAGRIKRKTAAAKAAGVGPLVYRIEEVAAALASSVRHVQRMVHRGEFPPPDVRNKRFVRWRVETVRAWLDDQSAAARAEKGGRA